MKSSAVKCPNTSDQDCSSRIKLIIAGIRVYIKVGPIELSSNTSLVKLCTITHLLRLCLFTQWSLNQLTVKES